MSSRYQDAMAIVREKGKPDLFVTFTCNPKWLEIVEELLPGQQAEDRPDIAARVFKMKLDELIKDIDQRKIFGKVTARIHVVEFQKRGLPHVHILLILEEKTVNVDQVEGFVRAEIPQDAELRGIIMKQMYHRCKKGFCLTDDNPNVCSKGFPKDFASSTAWNDEDTHPTYRRRSAAAGGFAGDDDTGRSYDNSRVVPYNSYLTKRYDAHINVEVCSSTKACKYLFKYIHKGGDRAMVRTGCSASIVKRSVRFDVTTRIDVCGRRLCDLAYRRQPVPYVAILSTIL